ncbi:pituitary adenylate cyclase-activating polypeptide type I receptor-like protein [Lates japonicus]|uniref:Pituitary adenylate cyclase-activating polypeptide type I receptor-like protein n=1 Tax=Lates japonicus TaxID=270547 RepID=A0AAD3QWP3_LATJO|nr:pituitary adenylate cyclase-activating polypeptide type I receptor-like protein [Lates japonicus]
MDEELGESRGGNELDSQGERGIYFLHLLNGRTVTVCIHVCLRDHWEALRVPDKSRHVARPLARVSMAMAERGGRAGRFVRTHVEIVIDLDETVAGEDDSLTQQRKQEHRGVREYEHSSEPGAF